MFISSRPLKLIALIALSLAFALLHGGPLYGTGAALVITILSQLYLPGWLLARVFGKHRASHPVTRFTWTLGAGMGLVVCLGALLRVLHLPISTYVIVLHGVMLGLALIPQSTIGNDPATWHFERRSIPLYLLLAVCCLTVLYASIERGQIRFNNFADQTIFVSYADWLVHHPEAPEIHTRLAGTIAANSGDVRMLTDGWTYNHATWVWTSGVPAAQVIWYDLSPLFVWAIPLVIFALAYELTGRESAAAWSAASLTLVGLMTLDGLVYRQNNLAFGQFGLIQLNTLRMMSRALMLPLALFAGLSYLRLPRLRDLTLVLLTGLSLAVMHPQPLVILMVSLAATTVLWWLAQPSRQRFRWALALAGTLVVTLLVPYFQRANTITSTRFTDEITDSIEDDIESVRYETPEYLLTLADLPLVGTAYIIQPSVIFYHPLIIVASILGLVAAFWWRHSLAAQYPLGATAVMLLTLFTPGFTALFARLTTLAALPGMVFTLPLALIFGVTFDVVIERLLVMLNLGRGNLAGRPYHIRIQGVIIVLIIAVIALLLFEPIPIPVSARDQIRAANQLQALRTMHATDQQLLDSLTGYLPPDEMSVLLTPNPVANYIIESVPGAVVTGGRRGHANKWAFDPTQRFFGEPSALYGNAVPWLDDFDLAFMAEFGVTHIVAQADDVRLPQLLFQPERFELLDTPAGYFVFRLHMPIVPDAIDALFQQMNILYSEEGEQRWNMGAFELNRPASPALWETFAEMWETNVEHAPDDDRSRYGLAITHTLMGRDEMALELWLELREAYPQIPMFHAAVAYTLQALNRSEEAVQILLDTLDNPQSAVRVLAARYLLTLTFFPLLDQEQIERIFSVSEAAPDVWEQLVVRPSLNEQHQRANLLMTAELFDRADNWLAQVPAAETSPDDLTARASILLAQGDVDNALDILRPALDPDEMAAARFLHPDRWEHNTAAQMYYLLLGGIAFREQRGEDAENAYRQAIAAGADSSVQAPLEYMRALDNATPRDFLPDCGEAGQEPVLVLSPPGLPLAMLEHRALYIMDVETVQNEAENTLSVCATYGNPTPSFGYNVNTWRVQAVSAETQFAVLEVPAHFVPPTMTRAYISLELPDDVPPLTPAQVYIEAMYDPSLILGRAVRNVVLNRPDAATPAPDATPANLRFGDYITLRSYTASHDEAALDVTLYWETTSPPPDDYQVFVHVLDANGQPAAQTDSAPVGNRYPTSQWRADILIEDRHAIPLDDLPPGEYEVRIGLYRLTDSTRLPITPTDERVANDSVLVYTFSR